MFNKYSSYSSGSTAGFSGFNFNTPNVTAQLKTTEELEAENRKLEKEAKRNEELKKAESLPNQVWVLIEAAKGDVRNRNESDAQAVANGILYGKVQRVVKGKTICFETRDGDIIEDDITVDQRIALELGIARVDSLCEQFMELAPGQGGRRAGEVLFAFSDEVFMNSNSTIMTDGIVMSEFRVPKGQAPSNKEEYLSKKSEVIQNSKDYRETRRKQSEDERNAQMLAAMGIKVPQSEPDKELATVGAPSSGSEEEFDPNQAM